MNTLKTIYNKLDNKTELAKHEIDLSSIDMLQKATLETVKWATAFEKTHKLLIEQAKFVLVQEDYFNRAMNDLQERLTPLKKQFSDLGLNYLDNIDVKKAISLTNKTFEINKAAGYIKQIIK